MNDTRGGIFTSRWMKQEEVHLLLMNDTRGDTFASKGMTQEEVHLLINEWHKRRDIYF